MDTVYFEGDPFDYQYQEMGPMRLPESITYAGTNETITVRDHQIVFQLVDVMNELNKDDKNLHIDFIPWLQLSPNGLYYHDGIRKPDGTVPTVTEVKNDPSLVLHKPDDPAIDEAKKKIQDITSDREFMAKMATNVYKAHKEFLGMDKHLI